MKLLRPSLKYHPLALLSGLFLLLGEAALASAEPMISLTGETQGTTYHIKYRDDRQRSFKKQIDAILTDIDQCLSSYRPDSELSEVNRSATHRFRSPYFYPVLRKSAEVFEATNGAFDPTVMPLVEAYGFGPKGGNRSGAVNVDSLLLFVGLRKVAFDSASIQKLKMGVRLDFNAIAQGYTVDVVAEFLDNQGIIQYMVEIGGEIRTKGRKQDGQSWTIGIEHPLRPGILYTSLKLDNRAMATSGSYRNRYEIKGQVFSHIINPQTGYPEQSEILSATVLAPDAGTADGFATAFVVLGLADTRQVLARRPDLDVFILYSSPDGQLKSFSTQGVNNL